MQKLRTALGNPLPTLQIQLYVGSHRVLLCLIGRSRGCLKSEARRGEPAPGDDGVTWTPGDPHQGCPPKQSSWGAGDQKFVLPLLFQHLFFKSEASAGEAAVPALKKLSGIQDNPKF